MADDDRDSVLRLVIIGGVFTAFLISFVASLAIDDYQTPPMLNGMMAAIVAWATGQEFLRRNGGG